ncbi:glycosyltransferase family 2 protein [Alcaligenes sp. AB3]|uniref:glycosyltransferase family 2 protein n=1 Tax=Alcaligenes sp. AB3 TaxID=2962569 RepID=UPI00288201D3|nr:glycosyltransferase family 2 protein [Alcaligenes sp. AB3]MDT0217934.1 glycosyltransferase family 2 protein [Alcaligenes sp. AB3]
MNDVVQSAPWVDFILVNYNGGKKIVDTINSIKQFSTTHSYTITVVDNDSTDQSCSLIAQQHPDTQIIQAHANLGFGTACNLGVAHTQAPNILLINPDAKLQTAVLSIFEQFLSTYPDSPSPILGGLALGIKGQPDFAFERFPNCFTLLLKAVGLGRLLRSRHPLTTPTQVDHVSGSLLFISREHYTALNGFDEQFFLYFEETDLQFRAREMGIPSFHIPAAQYFHEAGGTFTDKSFRGQCYSAGMKVYLKKRYGAAGRWIFTVYEVLDRLTRPARHIVKCLLREHKPNAPQSQ